MGERVNNRAPNSRARAKVRRSRRSSISPTHSGSIVGYSRICNFKLLSLLSSEELVALPADGTILSRIVSGTRITTGIEDIGVSKLWDMGFKGSGVVCAVIDSGIDSNHKDLQGAVKERYSVPELKGLPLHHHGTHIAGTIAARGTLVGVAPSVNLVDIRVYNQNGEGTDKAIVRGLKWLNSRISQGLQVRVVNMSIGGQKYVEEVAAELLKLEANGALVVVAAGNTGDGKEDSTETTFPASFETCMAVAAHDPRTHKMADFSDTNGYISCSAPGINTLSSMPSGYGILDGTSMSAAHVSGFCCLIFEKLLKSKPELKGAELLSEVRKELKKHKSQEHKCKKRECGSGMLSYREASSILQDIKTMQIPEK